MGNGVCSNLVSSGEPPPPASHEHFNHCIHTVVVLKDVLLLAVTKYSVRSMLAKEPALFRVHNYVNYYETLHFT